MPNIRIYELAKMLKIENKELIEKLKELGIEVKSHMSGLKEEDAAVVMEVFGLKQNQNTIIAQEKTIEEQKTEQNKQEYQNNKKGKHKKEKNPKQDFSKAEEKQIAEEENTEEEDVAVKYINENPTVKELAEVLGKNASEIVKSLMKKGIMAAINQNIEFDMAVAIAEEFDIILEKEEEKDTNSKPENEDKSKTAQTTQNTNVQPTSQTQSSNDSVKNEIEGKIKLEDKVEFIGGEEYTFQKDSGELQPSKEREESKEDMSIDREQHIFEDIIMNEPAPKYNEDLQESLMEEYEQGAKEAMERHQEVEEAIEIQRDIEEEEER